MWAFDLCVICLPTLSGLGGDSGPGLEIRVGLLHGCRIYVFTVSIVISEFVKFLMSFVSRY